MPRLPNVLFIMTDQHSPHIAGFAGDQHIETQGLDALAATSTRFDAAYCQSPLCVPSRMSLWSGKYPHNIDAWDNQSALPMGSVTLPGWLARHGYTTASVGKMHFRGQEQMHGFQYRPYGDLVESRVLCHQPDPPETADGRAQNHAIGRFPFAGSSHIPEALHGDRVVTIESLSWLLEYTNKQPWFFCASYFRPHFPLTAPGRYVRKYQEKNIPYPERPENYPNRLHPHDHFIVDDFDLTRFSQEQLELALASYYAALDYVDDLIGELLNGLNLENTYVIYTSDHGDLAGEHGLWWKRSYYEASSRVPLLIGGPGIEAGQQIDTPVELVDLFPTICDFAGIPTPTGLDGESLIPLLQGTPEQRQKKTARSELLGGNRKTRFRMVRDSRWKYVDFPDAPPRLFDMVNDPNELQDLVSSEPTDAPVTQLQAALDVGGRWEGVEEAYAASQAKRPTYSQIGNSSAQFHLQNGRVIESDDHLYDGSSLTNSAKE